MLIKFDLKRFSPLAMLLASLLSITACERKNGASVARSPSLGGAIPIPATGAYFGAWINPNGVSSNEEQETTALESQIGRKMALHMHYYGWSATPGSNSPSFPDVGNTQMSDDVANGRVPVISWSCSGDFSSVASGTYDSLIIATANAVKAFGTSIFIRWAWEMNSGSSAHCQGTSTNPAADYIQAWQRIYTLFKAQGVTNVAWLWNPGGEPGKNAQVAVQYYPGSDFVDWIGFDGYDKNVSATGDFGDIFNDFYTNLSGQGKPFLIGETGECQNQQASYLSSAQAEIEGGSNSKNYFFPLVKGFMYFDAVGPYKGCKDGSNWTFSAPNGINAFQAMGLDPFFNAIP